MPNHSDTATDFLITMFSPRTVGVDISYFSYSPFYLHKTDHLRFK